MRVLEVNVSRFNDNWCDCSRDWIVYGGSAVNLMISIAFEYDIVSVFRQINPLISHVLFLSQANFLVLEVGFKSSIDMEG